MARRSCPLESFEQCDTVPDELKKLNRSFLALFLILGDPVKLDLFSKLRFTKHCKWAPEDSVQTQFQSYAVPAGGQSRRLVVSRAKATRANQAYSAAGHQAEGE